MPTDLVEFLNSTSRDLSSRDVDGAPAKVLVATHRYNTARADLWDALTNKERIPRWFLPISGDLHVGGHFQLEGNAGGEILECVPPQRFGITWGMNGQVSWVNVELADDPAGGTCLRLEHIAHVPEEFWDQFGPGAVGVGWDSALLGLDQLFASEVTVTPEQAMVWLATEEGRGFIKHSSDVWCAADIAFGTDPEAARAAAERTRAAYTGESEAPMED